MGGPITCSRARGGPCGGGGGRWLGVRARDADGRGDPWRAPAQGISLRQAAGGRGHIPPGAGKTHSPSPSPCIIRSFTLYHPKTIRVSMPSKPHLRAFESCVGVMAASGVCAYASCTAMRHCGAQIRSERVRGRDVLPACQVSWDARRQRWCARDGAHRVFAARLCGWPLYVKIRHHRLPPDAPRWVQRQVELLQRDAAQRP